MSISIATRGYFTPATGGIIQSGGGTGFAPTQPRIPLISIINVKEEEGSFPEIQIVDIKNGNNHKP